MLVDGRELLVQTPRWRGYVFERHLLRHRDTKGQEGSLE